MRSIADAAPGRSGISELPTGGRYGMPLAGNAEPEGRPKPHGTT